jgi:choline-sulfatase
VRTPNIDALAARGVRFPKALCAAPVCAASRACLASGREYGRTGVRGNSDSYPLKQTTFYSLLRGAGYHTMGCGKFDLNKPEHHWNADGKYLLPEWGFSDGLNNAGKMDVIAAAKKAIPEPYALHLKSINLLDVHLEDFRHRSGGPRNAYAYTAPTPLPEEAYADNWVSANGLTLLENAPKDKPWFMQVNWPGPHDPEDITRRMESTVRQLQFPQPFNNTEFSAATHLAIRQNYSAMVENIDRWVGIYLEKLAQRKELDNTLVIFSSDHGEMLGDHNRWGKTLPYHPSASVPLILAGPGIRSGHVHAGPATNLDLPATFLDYAGTPVPQDMDSRSMRPLLQGQTEKHRDVALSGLNNWRLAYDGRHKLITGFSASQGRKSGANAGSLLFDLQEDPHESTDIAAKSPELVAQLAKSLADASVTRH